MTAAKISTYIGPGLRDYYLKSFFGNGMLVNTEKRLTNRLPTLSEEFTVSIKVKSFNILYCTQGI